MFGLQVMKRISQSRWQRLSLGFALVCVSGCAGDRAEDGQTGSSTLPTGTSGVTTSGSAGTDGGGTDSGGTGGGSGVRFDIAIPDMPGEDPDAPPKMGCGCDSQSLHNYIWISNSDASTVSKINTATVQEEGRYATRSDLDGDPSRTSVTISGRAMAVANRNGGVTKFWANREDCIDRNNNGQIDTSTGADNVLPWGEDECMAWFNPLDKEYRTNRPVAWTCINDREMLWTAAAKAVGMGEDADIYLLEGVTGEVVKMVTVPDYGGASTGPYGGAVDSTGSFWSVPMGGFTSSGPDHVLHRIDAITYEHQGFPTDNNIEPYGITVDGEDNVWVTNFGILPGVAAGRFSPSTETWDLVMGSGNDSGIVAGPDGRLWAGGNYDLHYIDPVTLALVELDLSMIGIKGVSLDSGGFVWVVDRAQAYKVDPANSQIVATYGGLDGPYTYSDMTGWAVQNTVGCVPPPPP